MMRPTISPLHSVTDTQLDEVGRRLGVTISARLRAIIKEVNGGQPTPRHVLCKVDSGETHVPLYEFARWDEPAKYVALCGVYHDELSVPRRFIVFATVDADMFFVDLEDTGLRVLCFQYVEGDYATHFGAGEMDVVAPTLEEFRESFFDLSHVQQ